MKYKTIAAVVLVVLAIFAFTACSGKNKVTLSVWCAQSDLEMITIMVEEFIAANPDVKDVVIQVCEDDVAREKFEEEPASAADVVCIPHDQLGALVEGGHLLEITGSEYIRAINENTELSVSAGQVHSAQYGFPSSFETHMLFYDKSIISEESVKTLEGILSSETGDADFEGGYLFAMEFDNAYFSANWFFTYGCTLFGENGEDGSLCDFDSDAGVAAMTYVMDNSDKMGNLTGSEAIKLFGENKLGAFIGGPWNASAVTEALKGNYGCVALPSVDGMSMKSFAGFKLYCVNSNTENESAAMDLAAWLTNPENQKTRFQTRNLTPVSSSLSDDPDVAVSATAKAVMAQGENALAMPKIPAMSSFWEVTGEFTLACYEGEIKAGELPEKLKELADSIRMS